MSAGVVSEIVNPYAEALMAVAQSNDLTSRIAEDVSGIMDILDSSEELRAFLANPLASNESKKAVLRQIASDQLHPYTLNFLMLLVDRKRILLLKDICKQYQELLRKLNQTVLAEVTSTVPLNESQTEAVRQKVIQITGARSVDLETHIDTDLIGGVVIKVGSQILDASLRGQLRRMGLQLSG